jgi:hypothetical protein
VIIEPMRNIARILVLRDEAARWRRDAERAPGRPRAEPNVASVGCDHDVGVTGQPDSTAEAEPVHRPRSRATAQSYTAPNAS